MVKDIFGAKKYILVPFLNYSIICFEKFSYPILLFGTKLLFNLTDLSLLFGLYYYLALKSTTSWTILFSTPSSKVLECLHELTEWWTLILKFQSRMPRDIAVRHLKNVCWEQQLIWRTK